MKTLSIAWLLAVTNVVTAQVTDSKLANVPESAPAVPALQIDAGKVTAHVSPMLYGLMTEEINYSYEGGLYGELIQNRTFRDHAKDPIHWSAVQDSGGTGAISLDESQRIEGTVLRRSLKLDAGQASTGRVGIANDGYWGIPVRSRTTYRLSFYAKCDSANGGPLTASIESNEGTKCFASAQVAQITDQWRKYSATLTTGDGLMPSAATRLVISTEKPGTFWFNLVSLFPPTYNDRPNGNRIGLMQLLSDLKPTFLRLPGGNFLQGSTIDDRFPWKKTLGALEQRPGHRGCWRYGASDGMGLLEFLEWCEDLHIQPVLAVYAGYSLKGEHVDAGPALQPFVDDALDEIEYVSGDTSTKWGAQCAKDGHPAPFPLTYVEIGNEDGADKSHSYEGRFAQFYDAIKAKYPNLKCIDSLGRKYWDGFAAKAQRTADLIDEHFYYKDALQMEDMASHYDNYDRSGPKIFVGEWATREGAPTSNMNAALADAAWMTGLDRNSDIVVLSCYAPLFVNVNPGGMQWSSDLIGYDTLSSYGSPSYYAQRMFSTALGDSVLSITSERIPTQTWQPPAKKAKRGQPSTLPVPQQLPTLFYVATKDSRKDTIYLKVINTAGTSQRLEINLSGAANIAAEGTLTTLSSAHPTDTNTIAEPNKIVPVVTKASGLGSAFTLTFAPWSINVLQIDSR